MGLFTPGFVVSERGFTHTISTLESYVPKNRHTRFLALAKEVLPLLLVHETCLGIFTPGFSAIDPAGSSAKPFTALTQADKQAAIVRLFFIDRIMLLAAGFAFLVSAFSIHSIAPPTPPTPPPILSVPPYSEVHSEIGPSLVL